MDLGKLVMATAPVNLIIAATIAISFLIGKQGALFDKFRLNSDQYAQAPPGDPKSQKLLDQLTILTRRLRIINLACRTLAGTIIVFIGTVTLTSVGVTFPGIASVKILTGASLMLGLVMMLAGFLLEVYDSCLEARSIDIAMKDVREAGRDPH